jgi:hypothetical protein
MMMQFFYLEPGSEHLIIKTADLRVVERLFSGADAGPPISVSSSGFSRVPMPVPGLPFWIPRPIRFNGARPISAASRKRLVTFPI